MKSTSIAVILNSLLMFYLPLMPASLPAEPLRIAVASNFYPTLKLIKHRYEQTHNNGLGLVKGSSGKLFAQIIHGAPYDVFLSADVERPKRLQQQGLVIIGSRITYAKGLLALTGSNLLQSTLLDSTQGLQQIIAAFDIHRFAIANPRIAPYGKAALDVLQYYHLNTQLKTKLVFGENVSQAFQFVQSGSAEFGLVPLSLARAHAIHYWQPPQATYRALEQQLVILKATTTPQVAQEFVSYLMTPDIQQFIEEQGYQRP